MSRELKTKEHERVQRPRTEDMEDTGIVVESLKRHLHNTPVAIKFYFNERLSVDATRPRKPLRYCEAVSKVMKTSKEMLLTEKDISCPIAKEVFGFNRKSRHMMSRVVEELLRNNRFKDEESAYKALQTVPRMEKVPKSILLSIDIPTPDIFVIYLQPVNIMKLVQAYQRATGKEMNLNVSSVMPVCGNCTTRPFVTGGTCISFGCPDCRECDGFSDDKLAVGIPLHEAILIARSLEQIEEEQVTT